MPVIQSATLFPFTEKRVKDWPTPSAGRVRLRDSGCPGLSLYVTPKLRAFYYRTRVAEVRLGTWPTLTVEEARKLAKTTVAPDPAKAAASKRAIREESTVAELWAWFDRHHVSALRESTARRYRDSWHLHIEPSLGAKQLSAVRRADVQSMADAIVDAGKPKVSKEGRPIRKTGGNGAGRHACAVLSAMYHAAAKDDAMHYRGDIPTAGIRRPKVASRARFLQPGELPAFLAALADEPQPWKLFWACCLFVGLRRGNVASARWADVSLDLGQWAVPEERSKTGAYLLVPIPAPVMVQLREWKAAMPGRLAEANEARRRLLTRGDAGVCDRLPLLSSTSLAEAGQYLFPAVLAPGKPSACPHVIDPKASWRRVLLRAGLSNLRPHDLRRSIGSWMALGGVGLPIIGAALGHKDQRSTAVYARLNDGAVRAAMERATEAMLAAGQVDSEHD